MGSAYLHAVAAGACLASVIVFAIVISQSDRANWGAFVGLYLCSIALVVNLMYLALTIVRVVEAFHA